jgi:hypothetical protein
MSEVEVRFPERSEFWRENVSFDMMGSPREHFAMYAEGFHTGARALVARLATGPLFTMFEACPIIFLYRHALELYLKAIAIWGRDLLDLAGVSCPDPGKALTNHPLRDLMPTMEAVVRALGWDWDLGTDSLRTKQDFDALLNELDRVDPKSYAFRYPVDKKGNASLPEGYTLRFPEFVRRLDDLLQALDGMATELEYRLEEAREAAYQHQQAEAEAARDFEMEMRADLDPGPEA